MSYEPEADVLRIGMGGWLTDYAAEIGKGAIHVGPESPLEYF